MASRVGGKPFFMPLEENRKTPADRSFSYRKMIRLREQWAMQFHTDFDPAG